MPPKEGLVLSLLSPWGSDFPLSQLGAHILAQSLNSSSNDLSKKLAPSHLSLAENPLVTSNRVDQIAFPGQQDPAARCVCLFKRVSSPLLLPPAPVLPAVLQRHMEELHGLWVSLIR